MLLCRKLEHNLQTFISFMAASYPYMVKNSSFLETFKLLHSYWGHKNTQMDYY